MGRVRVIGPAIIRLAIMQNAVIHRSGARAVVGKIPLYFSSIRIWESVFALPFAYMAMVLASDATIGHGWPGWHTFFWITAGMFGARTLGMAANRLINSREDAANPRTVDRHLPSGLLKSWEVAGMAVVGLLILFYAAARLNGLTLFLAPFAAVYVVLYSYAKYFTWLCNFFLGWALALAPAAAWLGVTGQPALEMMLLSLVVAMWAGGFDVIYACTDYEFDRGYGIRSVPRKIGIAETLWLARIMHFIAAAALLTLGILMDLGWPYYIGWIIAVGLLIYQNSLVKPDDLSRIGAAFFRVNGYISVQLLGFTILSLMV